MRASHPVQLGLVLMIPSLPVASVPPPLTSRVPDRGWVACVRRPSTPPNSAAAVFLLAAGLGFRVVTCLTPAPCPPPLSPMCVWC